MNSGVICIMSWTKAMIGVTEQTCVHNSLSKLRSVLGDVTQG